MATPSVGITYDPIMGAHHADDFHWERPERIYCIYQILLDIGLIPLLKAVKSREATHEELYFAHSTDYVEKIISLLSRPAGQIYLSDNDMYANENTLTAALTAAGSTLDLTKKVIEGTLDSGFAIVRPPGHHAMPGKCMGFCYFNNIGIAAVYAAKVGRRVLIVDIDVHHGNATERLVHNRKDLPNLNFISIHRWDNGQFYPGTGRPKETKRVTNIGFNGYKSDEYYLNVFHHRVVPKAREFQPDLILVSCGFDAAAGDPLGECGVTPKGYFELIKILQHICPSIVLVLEGGYNLQAVSRSALACTQALLRLPFDEPENVNIPYSEIFVTND